MYIINLFENRIKRKAFRLHPALDPSLYQITNNMAETYKWRCHSYFEEGGKEVNDVGYVMISLSDDTIIPIPRGDEHIRGYALLYEPEFKQINSRDYYPIFTLGGNYIFSEEDKKLMLVVAKKYFSYGGKDYPLSGGNEFRNVSMMLSDFVKRDGNITISHNELPPSGQRVYEGLVNLAETIAHARQSGRPSDMSKAFRTAMKFSDSCRMFYPKITVVDFDLNDFLVTKETLKTLSDEGDLQGLEEYIFGFNGFKNQLHRKLKEFHKSDERSWNADDARAMWGDNLELAIARLAQI